MNFNERVAKIVILVFLILTIFAIIYVACQDTGPKLYCSSCLSSNVTVTGYGIVASQRDNKELFDTTIKTHAKYHLECLRCGWRSDVKR